MNKRIEVLSKMLEIEKINNKSGTIMVDANLIYPIITEYYSKFTNIKLHIAPIYALIKEVDVLRREEIKEQLANIAENLSDINNRED